MKRSTAPSDFLTQEEKEEVEAAIAAAEKETSAELKQIIVRHCWGNVRDKAESLFMKYKLHETELRNCVLVLLVTANRELVIFGDQGIHEKVGEEFWVDMKDTMVSYFKGNEFGSGLAEGIKSIGEKLKEHFPYQADDINEISNEVVYED